METIIVVRIVTCARACVCCLVSMRNSFVLRRDELAICVHFLHRRTCRTFATRTGLLSRSMRSNEKITDAREGASYFCIPIFTAIFICERAAISVRTQTNFAITDHKLLRYIWRGLRMIIAWHIACRNRQQIGSQPIREKREATR